MKLFSLLVIVIIRALHATLRVQHVHVENIANTPQYILSFWHAHLLLMVQIPFRRPMCVISSRSKDGEISAAVFKWYGVDCVRGSSSRGGGSALRELIRKARTGSSLGFTPDGPRGPARIAKEGVVLAAQLSGLPIIPIAFAARRKKLLRSWDRMIVPYPFTKALFLYGTPLLVPRDGDIEEWRQVVERKMNELADEAERRIQGDER